MCNNNALYYITNPVCLSSFLSVFNTLPIRNSNLRLAHIFTHFSDILQSSTPTRSMFDVIFFVTRKESRA